MQISKKDIEVNSLNDQLVQAKNEINKLSTLVSNLQTSMESKEDDLNKVTFFLLLWMAFLK